MSETAPAVENLTLGLEDPVASPDVAETANWAAVASLSLGVFGLVTAEFLPTSLLTRMASDLDISVGVAGQTVTATAVVGGIAGVATAMVTRGIDRRLVLWSLTLLLLVSNVLSAVASSLTTLLVARVLLGIALGGFWSMAGALALRLVPPDKVARAMSIVFTGVSLATVCAAPVGAYVGDLWGWRAAFVLAGVVGAVALVVQLATMPKLPAVGAPGFATLLELLGGPGLRTTLIALVLVISGHFAGFTYVRPFLEQVPGFGIEAISLILLAFGIGGFLGNLAAAPVIERSIKASVLLGALAIALIALILVAFGSSVTLSAGGIALWGFFFGFLPVSFQTWAVRMASDQAETAGGLLVAAFQIAITSGAVFGGLLIDGLGPLGVMAYAATGTVAGAVVVLAFAKGPAARGAA